MKPSQTLDGEIARIRAEYDVKDASTAYGAQYRAFNPMEFGYRAQQLKCLAQLLRETGRRDLAGMRILDVGCGSGRLLGDLLGLGAEPGLLCGVDLMPARLEAARLLHPQIRFQLADGATLPLADGMFDLVLQTVVFSSIALPELRQQLAGEMLRVLKPGGFIFWWDMLQTVEVAGRQSLHPQELFASLAYQGRLVSWLPKPSEGLAKRRWRYSLGWLVDLLAAKPTHLAALLGPKMER